MKPDAVLINTARGAVVDNGALKAALQTHSMAGAVLDVWEGEPDVDVDLARLTRVATPHIAGYSFDSKVEGTRMLEEALRSWLIARADYVPPAWHCGAALDSLRSKDLTLHALPVQDALNGLNEVRWLNVLVRQAYNLRKNDTHFRLTVLAAAPSERAAAFRELRRTYPVRRSRGRFTVKTMIPKWLEDVVTKGLGMAVEE